MSKNKYKYEPDYAALYPGVEIPPKVLDALKESDRKMKYYEYDLKYEPFTIDPETGVPMFLPSREDSLDRLLELDKQFGDASANPEEFLIDALYIQEQLQELRGCLALLDEDERALIRALFYEGLAERKYAAKLGVCQKTINKRRHKVLCKIKEILNN